MITGACIVTFLIFPPMFFFKLDISDKLYQLGFLLALFGTVLPPFLFAVGMVNIKIRNSTVNTIMIAIKNFVLYLVKILNQNIIKNKLVF